MHVYVQKSISTTRPRSPASFSGRRPGVLNHCWVPWISGAVPSTGSVDPDFASLPPAAWRAGAAPGCVPRTSASRLRAVAVSSRALVGLTSTDGRSSAIADWNRVSYPPAISAATTTITTPIAICSRPLCLDRREVSLRPPSISAYRTAADPMPYASATVSRPAVNDCDADTVMTPARIGPAQGA